MPASQSTSFRLAFDEYLVQLRSKPNSKKTKFFVGMLSNTGCVTEQDVQTSLKQLLERSSTSRLRKIAERVLPPVINALRDYYGVVDTLVQSYPMPLALIWGSFKIVIEAGYRYTNLFELLQDQMSQLSTYISRLTEYEKLYYSFSPVQKALSRSYVHIIEFFYRVNKQCSQSSMKQLMGSFVTNNKMVNLLESLKVDANEVSEECDLAEKQLHQQDRELALNHMEDVQREHEAQGEWRQKFMFYKDLEMRESLSRWIGGRNDTYIVHHERNLSRKHPETCKWILNNRKYSTWINEDTKSPVLWVYGRPGFGKSILCSSVIDHIQQSNNQNAVVMIFLRFDDPVQEIDLFRNIADQLMFLLFERVTGFPQALTSFLAGNRNDIRLLRKLIGLLIAELDTKTYFFIDGIDEVYDTNIVGNLLNFLNHEVTNNRESLRLWCSSQPQSKIQLDQVITLELKPSFVASDIKSYLKSAAERSDNSDDYDKEYNTNLKVIIDKFDPEGCFLLASSMVESLASTYSTFEMIEQADEFPQTMEQYYERIMDRILERDARGVELARLVLSLITFAKRPLRMSEIKEAIAMAEAGSDLDRRREPHSQKLMTLCTPLIEFFRYGKNCQVPNHIREEGGEFRLTHSVVKKFLLRYKKKGTDSTFVGEDVIADRCLWYLLQPKYNKLLVKQDSRVFETANHEHVRNHRFLLYASKNWHFHFDDKEPNEENFNRVKSFLKSTNFITCLQIQSLYIIGHFMQNFDEDGRGRFAKRSLPQWFTGDKAENLNIQYLEFVEEWGHLLQRGLSDDCHGEINRCLFGALGQTNFLHNGISKYQSFILQDTQTIIPADLVEFDYVSPDGSRLEIFRCSKASQSKLLHETWLLSDAKSPFIEERSEISLPVETASSLKYYQKPGSRTFPLIPEAYSSERSNIVQLTTSDQDILVGPMIISKTVLSDEAQGKYTLYNGLSPNDYWEDIQINNSILVKSRRKEPPKNAGRNKVRKQQWSNFKGKESGTAPTGDGAQHNHSASEDDFLDDSISTESSSGLEQLSSAEESWEEESDKASFIIESDASENNYSLSKKGFDEKALQSDNESCNASEFSFRSELPNKKPSKKSNVEGGVLDEKVNIQFDHIDSDDSDLFSGYEASDSGSEASKSDHEQDELGYYIKIASAAPRSGHWSCDICRNDVKVRYHCRICSRDNFDICAGCIAAEKWCKNKEHQLYKMYNQDILGVISIDDMKVRQKLMVWSTQSEIPAQVFRYSSTAATLLYDSPTAVHPKESLVVWPLGSHQILFASALQNQYFKLKLQSALKRGKQVSVRLKFSKCGTYLHVVSFEAVKFRHSSDPNRSAAMKTYKTTACELSFSVITYKLNEQNPTRIAPERVWQTQVSVSKRFSASVFQLPFTVTWGSAEVYVTFSDPCLRVFRAQLFAPGGVTGSEAVAVHVPRNRMFLPRSAKERFVHFLPPTDMQMDALVIISSRSRNKQSPPIGVHLKAEDLGGWVPMSENDGTNRKVAKMREDVMDDFDSEDDCDLIPFSIYN